MVRDRHARLWEGKLATLKSFKDDCSREQVAQGYECVVSRLKISTTMKPDDIIEAFEMEAIMRKNYRATLRRCCASGSGRNSSFSLRVE